MTLSNLIPAYNMVCTKLHLVVIFARHHDHMILKLESAGLGFYVKATEAQERLGISISYGTDSGRRGSV